MNFDLSDEQKALREAARDALTRQNLIEAAHEMLDGKDGPDLWPAAKEAGWPGLLISEDNGGAGLGAVDALLVAIECGRTLAGVPIMGHITATAVLDSAADAVGERLAAFAEGDERAAFVGAMPPGDLDEGWTVDPESGMARADAPTADVSGSEATVSGSVAFVPNAAGADALVVVAVSGGSLVAILVDAGADGVTVEPVVRYDVTRNLAHVRLDGAKGTVLEGACEDTIRAAWFLAQAWIAAESLGSVETALETSVAYAKERFTFGRAIGSYQAIKHGLVEMLRQLENTRSLVYYAGWAYEDKPEEFALAASAARTAGGHALDYGSRQQINVHGGIGATWEHDAPLYFRRAQLSRRLLGGTGAATDRVAGELLAAASTA